MKFDETYKLTKNEVQLLLNLVTFENRKDHEIGRNDGKLVELRIKLDKINRYMTDFKIPFFDVEL